MSRKFQTKQTFASENYFLLPFRFTALDNELYLLSTDYGEWCCVTFSQLQQIIAKKPIVDEKLFFELKSKHIITTDSTGVQRDLLASKYKTKKSFIENFSQLHIFVLTVRCNNSCVYCQASRKSIHSDHTHFDMSDEVLHKSIQLFLSMPSQKLTLEFQGGESTLNMKHIRNAVELVEKYNTDKDIQFVVCTNLCDLEESDLDYLIDKNFYISTSLDGPQFLHDANRKFSQGGAHGALSLNLEKIKQKNAFSNVSALMTTTRVSLDYHKEIIDEYVRQGFRSIFIRELNPYGFAQKYFHKIGYSTEDFLAFYEKSFDYIISINKKGIAFRESYAGLILKKLLTPWSTGFVDLQSPCGSGFGVTLYNYNGNIYPSDESRMMAETGDEYFKMGNVLHDSVEDIFLGSTMKKIAAAGVNDSLPGCCDCAFAPYCGADPVRRYQVTGSIYGRPGQDEYCAKNKGIISLLIKKLLNSDSETKAILMRWGMQ